VSLQTSVFISEEYNVKVNSEELVGITEYLTLYKRCCINRCRYNRVRLHLREVHCTMVTEVRNGGKFLSKRKCKWENQTKKITQRSEEEIEERIYIGADGLQVTYCFVDCKVTGRIKHKISCYQSQT